MHKPILILLLAALSIPASAEPLEGDYLYRVTTIRAATGEFQGLLEWHSELNDSGFYAKAGQDRPLLMRHTQGDQWDLLVIVPMQSWVDFHSPSASAKRDNAEREHAALLAKSDALVAFSEDHFAYGPPWSALNTEFDDNGFFHIEMFKAAPGKADALLEQRRMENDYLESTGQVANTIFRRAAGSDIDVFTIGFHPSFEAFAAPAKVTVDEKNVEAKAAGFKSLADISFYLRSLISGHHDTLAVKAE